MHEVFPVLAGVLVGLVLLRVHSPRMKTLAFVALSVALGVTATVISGEYVIGWEFVLIDIPVVMLSAAAVVVLAPRARTWATARRLAR
ncbi:MAG: hypothetical protein DCC58_03415 [Chloroflexi bacterium]|nr:MAG: hypothetical protein DCC58_03415 [Chloroflexota bacterium]